MPDAMRGMMAVAASAAIMSACAAGSPAGPTPQPVTIRVAFTNAADAKDLPVLLAHEALRTQGYIIEAKHFDANDLAVEAITRGDADIAHGSVRGFWVAMDKGAPITTVMDNDGNSWTITARNDIARCEELSGKRFAISGQSGFSTLMAKYHLRTQCSGAAPNYLIIASAANRVAAMLAGEVDAATLAAEDVIAINAKAPGQYRTLVNFARVLPGMMIGGTYARTSFVQSQPGAVKAYVRAVLQARRSLAADPELTRREIARLKLADTGNIPAIAQAFRDNNTWDANGGMSRDGLRATIQYLVDIGDLKTEPDVARIADFTFLDQVLAEIGRK